MRSLALICVLLGASAALAHDVPVNPSTCTFDPFELTAPDAGLSATVAAPAAADAVRVVYDVATATAQFQQRIVTPRAFTIAGGAGAVALPQAFNAQLAASGDLHADQVALGVTLGGVAATVQVSLTTAVTVASDLVATGTPMAGDGRFTLVGVIPAGRLPAPLDTAATVVRLGCRVTPAPDLDQFALAPTVSALAGTLSGSKGQLRAALQGGVISPATVTGGPAILHLDAGGASLATLEFPGGFTAQGRDLVAQGAGGSRLTLRPGNGRAPARLRAALPGVAVPANATGSVDVQAILVAGPMTARGSRPFRARSGTLRAGS
jgi:hypothetical protein